MQFPRRASPASTYESQAARWKQGFKPVAAGSGGGGGRQTDLEGALVSELCSSIGSSSFPPREVLQKLLRYLHTLDHEYVCELLDDKFQNPLWQVQAKAVSVLGAILKSSEAEFYKRYYFERLDTIGALCRARKDMLRARADKVYNVLKDYVPPPVKSASERGFMHTSPVIASTQAPAAELMPGFDSPRSNSEPLPGPAPVPVSAFSFISANTQEPDEAPEPSPLSSPSAPAADGSAFSFLNGGRAGMAPIAAPAVVDAGKAPPVATLPSTMVSASPPAATSAFAFIAASSPAASPPTRPTPTPSAPSMSAVGVSGFSFLNQPIASEAAQSTPDVPAPAPAPPAASIENKSAFGFIAAVPSTTAPLQIRPQQPRHDVFDSLPLPTPSMPGAVLQQTPSAEVAPVEEEEVDPIHDAFEGLSTEPDAERPLDGGAALRNVSTDNSPYQEVETPVAREDIREVILEVEMPPGPMGIMLDRTITDMVVIERFIPLPSGEKGYLEMHPAICPGCALVSINLIHVEERGIDEVGPILASLGASPKLLRFKKLMCRGRTVNPSTLMMPYVAPPPLQEVNNNNNSNDDDDDEEANSDDDQPEGGEEFMNELNGYNDGLVGIEKQLDALILKERNAIPVGDRKNALAQMHGHVERIQTQGIDSVIFGPNPPPNYEEVKRYRSSLVRKAETLAQRIHLTATSTPGAVPISKEFSVSPESIMMPGFQPPIAASTVSSVHDPPLGLSQLQAASGFQFINESEQNVETDRHSGSSYGFSFLRDPPAEAQSSISQAPTSPSSSFGFLQNSAASVGAVGLSNSTTDAPASVFAGLSLRDDSSASFTSDPLSESSHGRPMGIQDLSMSVTSMAGAGGYPGGTSMAPSSTMASAGTSVPSADTTYSAFGFLSTNGPSDTLTSSSSSAELSSSPTAFGFLQGNASAMMGTASSTSSQPMPPPTMQSSVEPSESGSVFSFISN